MSFIYQPGSIVAPLTAGGVAYGTGSTARMSTAGTAGQALISNGTGAPTWGSAGGAEGYVLQATGINAPPGSGNPTDSYGII